jgi:hypothetical protein
MEFKLIPNTPAEGAEAIAEHPARADGSFSISSRPVIDEGEAEASAADAPQLPRSYGTRTLWLMPRDPESLYAFWDIDWRAAFGDETPIERKVHLRIIRGDGSEEIALEVEPTAGSCAITVAKADEYYTGDLGFYQPANSWNSVATSAAALMPADESGEPQNPEFATIPIHLNFQRLIDAFRASQHESATITQMLADLRGRVQSPETTARVSSEEREIARALDNAAGSTPQVQPAKEPQPDLWARIEADRVLGFGATSPKSGFGGSSRAI